MPSARELGAECSNLLRPCAPDDQGGGKGGRGAVSRPIEVVVLNC
jgi:hypothetical protein